MKKERLIEMCGTKKEKLIKEVNRGLRTSNEAINVFGGYVIAMNEVSEEIADTMLKEELSNIFIDASELFINAEAKRAEIMGFNHD